MFDRAQYMREYMRRYMRERRAAKKRALALARGEAHGFENEAAAKKEQPENKEEEE